MRFKIKHFYIFLLTTCFIILLGCQLQEPSKSHGVLYLENRSNKLKVLVHNKNDIIRLIGQPHSKSVSTNNEWIFIERVITRGAYHKLGQNVLKTNNVLVLKFNKYGVLIEKNFLNKDDIKKLTFSKKDTENNLTKKSFVQQFLSSLKAKMYGKR
jgi:outer membrane protein assembly factor BamE (lipoprotein component of BamABCDE complex)